MSWRTFLGIIESLQKVNWSGQLGWHYLSEPLLDERLSELMDIAHKNLPSAKITLETNGDLLTIGKAEELINAGLLHARIARHPPFGVKWDRRIEEITQRWPHVFSQYCPSETGTIYDLGGHVKSPMVNAKRSKVCHSTRNQLAVRTDGSVTLCCCDYYGNISYGNLPNTPLMEIWNSPRFTRDRAALARGERPYPMCQKCSGLN